MTEVRKFDAEVGKVLQLVIHSIYTNKDIFLRELISNASDACDKLRYEAINNPNLLAPNTEFKIKVILCKDTITVEDNGIGMNYRELIDNLGTIANSGTQKFLSELSEQKEGDVNLIGQFGVGFYSAFMVANEVTVYSSKAGEEKAYVWYSKGDGEYNISITEEEVHGTKIVMKIRDSESEYLDKFKLEHIVKTYSDHIPFPIELVDAEQDAKIINRGSALWLRPKAEISEEQYKEFYQHISSMPDNPYAVLHNKAEGSIEYTNLLFIPSAKPYDLYHPERKARVKLYVRQVFITDEEVNIIPSYLRFIKGVVDSEDLPLNISRETLQHNAVIRKISKSIVKKILSTLKHKAEEDKDAYNKFWASFGEVIKEGLCEHTLDEKEKILEICRFYTDDPSDTSISLDEYVGSMLEGQTQIFYISGSDLDNLRGSPQLEGFKKRGIKVLLLPDNVDDFWVNVVHQYKDKELKSVSAPDIDLNKIKHVEEDEVAPTAQNDSELVEFIKETLKERVQDVQVTSKLVDSPACLAIPQGGMNVRMERFLIEQKQLTGSRAKILEINPEHAVLKRLSQNINQDAEEAGALVELIFNQACLIEGESIKEPKKFVKLINDYIQQAI